MDWNPGRDRADLERDTLRIGMEVRLGENNRRLRATGPGGGEIPLDPAQVEVTVQRGRDEYPVDVGRDHLNLRGLPCLLALEARPTREDRRDKGRVPCIPARERDPVPH